MKKRGWIGVLFVICCLALLTACGLDQTEKAQAAKKMDDVQKESAYPEADAVAKEAYQAILDVDRSKILKMASTELYQDLSNPKTTDPDFSDQDIEQLKVSDPVIPGNYKASIQTSDYFLASHYDKTKETMYYLLAIQPQTKLADRFEWHTYTPNKEYQVFKIELIKVNKQWVLDENSDWFSMSTNDRAKFIDKLMHEKDKHTTVLHQDTLLEK
ncbi:hypothetical protein [Listeria newyorkensis]|uniref:hypothetical protein n=1 Tax=Listeria newyorkensis TaxID=1497681 RepID=UPI0010F63510|nr:hypothetical protein [Listeria newyorkensis]